MELSMMMYQRGEGSPLFGAMRFLSWNYQELGNSQTSRNIRKIVREQALIVCFLMEPCLDKEGFEKLYNNLPFLYHTIVKHPDSRGGLALTQKKYVSMEVINFTANHVLAKVVFDMFLWLAGSTLKGEVVETMSSLEKICGWSLALHW